MSSTVGCILCTSAEQNEVLYGEWIKRSDICVHYYCLLLTTQLIQRGDDDEGIFGFLENDIKSEAKRIKDQRCCFCKKKQANIMCCQLKCMRSFHVGCGVKNECSFHFVDTFQSFCDKHGARSEAGSIVGTDKCHKPNDKCCICLEIMKKYNPVTSIQSVCCKSGWFHKYCLAKLAITSGYLFKCPLCNNTDTFRNDVVHKGIFVPDRDATWELEPNAFADLLERPSTCSAVDCQCPSGRGHTIKRWKLCYCMSCGTNPVHKLCKIDHGRAYVCNECSVIMKKSNISNDVLADTDDTDNTDNSDDEDAEIDVLNDNNENKLMSPVNCELKSSPLPLPVAIPQNVPQLNLYDDSDSDNVPCPFGFKRKKMGFLPPDDSDRSDSDSSIQKHVIKSFHSKQPIGGERLPCADENDSHSPIAMCCESGASSSSQDNHKQFTISLRQRTSLVKPTTYNEHKLSLDNEFQMILKRNEVDLKQMAARVVDSSSLKTVDQSNCDSFVNSPNYCQPTNGRLKRKRASNSVMPVVSSTLHNYFKPISDVAGRQEVSMASTVAVETTTTTTTTTTTPSITDKIPNDNQIDTHNVPPPPPQDVKTENVSKTVCSLPCNE